MANPERGEVDLEVNGKRYRLKLGIQGLRQLQETVSTPAHPVTFLEVMAGAFRGNIVYLVAIIWCACERHHPELTQKDVDRLLDDLGGLQAVPVMIETVRKLMESTDLDKKDRSVVKKTPGGRPTLAGEATTGTTGTDSISRRAKSA